MIKRGDGVICIKNFETVYEAGKVYKVDYTSNDVDVNYVYIAEENHFGRYAFFIPTNENTLCFDEYFMPLAEYREQQMKSILDG